jgi:protein-S-isoprenylcysteine O-methyltransferase Ste14
MSNRFLQRGGGWVIGQFLLVLAVAVLCFTRHAAEKSLPLFAGGVVLLVISTVLGIAGFLALGRNLTPFPKPSANARFVQRGIYGLIRHPLYTSILSAAFGWSLLRQSWPALVVSAGLAVFLDAKARREERWLRRRFPDYADYERRVRRFIPWTY